MKPFTASERRILITRWAGEAWRRICTEEKYDSIRYKCWLNTGCLITADGSDDSLIKPEGLPNYQVPPPSMLDPENAAGSDNSSNLVPVEDEESFEKVLELSNEDEMLSPADDEYEAADGNIFDFIDQICVE